MATQLPDGRWQARKRTSAGRIVGYGSTAELADEDLATKLKALSTPSMPQEGVKLHDIAKVIWFPRIEGLKPLTVKKYKGVYVNWIRDELGSKEPKDITVHDCQMFVNKVERELGPRSAIFAREVLSQILKCAIYHPPCEMRFNPASIVKSPPKPEKRERVIDVETARELLESVKGTDMSAPVFFALVIGLRRGEVAGLKWDDLDRQTGELRIVRQRQAVRPMGVHDVSLKSSGSKRTLRLPPALIAEIDARGDLDHERICTHRMEPWIPDTITEHWTKIRPATLKDWTYHDLRHGAAGLLYALGCNLLEIRDVLGHKSIDETLLYTHASNEARTKAIANMEALFR